MLIRSLSSVWRVLALCLLSLLVACGGGKGDAAPPPTGFTVTPGDGQATITFTGTPGVEYWLLYAQGSTVSTKNLSGPHTWVTNISSPYTVYGLTNDQVYSFTVNGRTNGGPGGEGAPTQTVTPTQAARVWTAATGLGSSMLKALSVGTVSAASKYLAVGSSNAMLSSADGAAWTAVAAPAVGNWNASVNALSNYIVVGDAGLVTTSADAISWSTPATVASGKNLYALASNGSRVVAVGQSGSIVYSDNASTWTPATLPATATDLWGVSYSSTGRWMAVGAANTVLTSTDGSTWVAASSVPVAAADLFAVTVRASGSTASYVAVGTAGTVWTSSDGQTWTAQTAASSNDLHAVVASSSRFVAAGLNGSMVSSLDGITWVAQTSGSTNGLQALLLANSQFLAVGDNGTGRYSK